MVTGGIPGADPGGPDPPPPFLRKFCLFLMQISPSSKVVGPPPPPPFFFSRKLPLDPSLLKFLDRPPYSDDVHATQQHPPLESVSFLRVIHQGGGLCGIVAQCMQPLVNKKSLVLGKCDYRIRSIRRRSRIDAAFE